ncbi:MAG: hypothetical protein ABIK77_07880 [candidate division WOR-3 bacterium]
MLIAKLSDYPIVIDYNFLLRILPFFNSRDSYLIEFFITMA